jgi:NAD(P)-dependent dehydrogenase (short-subunit alcohol dehydrogenase family)
MTGKVAIIAGGSQGIGAALVTGYRGRGWAVVATGSTITPSQDADVVTVSGDIADPATAGQIVGVALERFGRIDTLANNASVFISKPFTGYTTTDYATAVRVNLTGFFWPTQRAIAEMATRYGGHVVNVSAIPAEVADAGAPAVLTALTNGALAAATRSLAVEYAAYGIRVSPRAAALRDDHTRQRRRRLLWPGSPRPGARLARSCRDPARGRPEDRAVAESGYLHPDPHRHEELGERDPRPVRGEGPRLSGRPRPVRPGGIRPAGQR